MSLSEKYGKWAFVAGGSEGLGGAYSDRLAKEGFSVIVTGRHQEKIDMKCEQLEKDFGVETKGLIIDFGHDDALAVVQEATKDAEVGFLVYNVGLADMKPFSERDIDFEMYRLNANVRSLLGLTLHFTKKMKAQGKGAIVLMASSGGVIGTPFIQTYSATKAYVFTLAEALWGELADDGIDVVGVLPGNTIGQNYKDIAPGTKGYQTGAEVVEEVFNVLGKEPTIITGEQTRQTYGPLFHQEERKQQIELMMSAKDVMKDMMKGFEKGAKKEPVTK